MTKQVPVVLKRTGRIYGADDNMSMRVDSSREQLTGESGSMGCCAGRSKLEARLVVLVILLTGLGLALLIAVGVLSSKLSGEQQDENGDYSTTTENSITICTTPGCLRTALAISEAMNTSVNPCKDFYQFACGGWIKKYPIPGDKGRYSNFDSVQESVLNRYKTILETPATKDDSEAVAKTKDLYAGCMGGDEVWKGNLPFLLSSLDTLGGWPILNSTWNNDTFHWLDAEVSMSKSPGSTGSSRGALFQLDLNFDPKNTTRNILLLDQPDTFLNREFLINASQYENKITAYKTLIQNVAKVLTSMKTDKELSDDIDEIVNFETQIAKISSPPELRRDPILMYNLMTLKDVTDNLTEGNIDFVKLMQKVFKGIPLTEDISEDEPIIVRQIDYIKNVTKLITDTSPKILANYIVWRYIQNLLWHISREMQDYYLQYRKVLSGVTAAEDSWKKCLSIVDSGMGMALGSQFVKQYFQPESKKEAVKMIGFIEKAFSDEMIKNLTWMDDKTKDIAMKKAQNMTKFIGFPDWIINSTALDEYYKESIAGIKPSRHLENLKNVAIAEVNRDLKTLRDHPADKTKWYMTPGTVNAYYMPEVNSITFPAGILQPPFYEQGSPMAVNFGGIGSVIGHEITHGFDDQGRQFDQEGNLKDWWSQSAADSFKNLSECYVKQYDEYCPDELNETKCVNGKNTLGENIADNGGIKASFKAYQQWKVGKMEHPLPGLTNYSPEQLFFISFSQVWCSNTKPETMEQLLLADPHSPPQFRVIGTLANSEEFTEAFHCPVPADTKKCHLW